MMKPFALFTPAALLACLPLVSVAQSPSAPRPALTPPEARISDARIGEDLRLFEVQQARLKQLNSSGRHPLSSYAMAKAQCWLDVSRHEYARNDRSEFPQQALEQSQLIAGFLEGQGPAHDPSAQTPLINGAARLREDLWGRLATLKRQPGAECVQGLIACAEVELVHAGNEENQQQWRHAKPYVEIAEGQVLRAEQGALACAPAKVVQAAAPMPAPAPSPAVSPKSASVQKWTLSGDALFVFARHNLGSVLPQGRAALEALVAKLSADYERIDHIQVVGHTDYLGSDASNDHLSWRRAETIRDRLMQGLPGVAVSAYGMGSRQPVKACDDSMARKALISCLQPNRRVEISVVGQLVPSSPLSPTLKP